MNTLFVSVLASRRLHGIEPFAYMRDLFCLLPRWPNHRLLELAPVNWKETLQNEDAKQALEANRLRRAMLSL